MIGYGVASTAFAGLAITMVIRRESGVLKRIRATPLPPAIYLVAVLVSTFITFLIEAGLIIVLGRVLFSVGLPGPAALAARRARDRRGCVRCAGPRRHGARAIGRRLLGGRQLRLPADGDHLRHVLLAREVPGVPAGDRGRPAADLLHEAHPRRDGAPPPSVDGDASLVRRSSGARSALSLRFAASAGSRASDDVTPAPAEPLYLRWQIPHSHSSSTATTRRGSKYA